MEKPPFVRRVQPARSPITDATAHTRILIILWTGGHLSHHERALFIHHACLTVSIISPRRALASARGERSASSLSSRREEARGNAPARHECRRVCTHAVTRARARARLFSRVVIFCLPPHSSCLLPPHRSPHLIFSRQSLLDATMQSVRCGGNKCVCWIDS